MLLIARLEIAFSPFELLPNLRRKKGRGLKSPASSTRLVESISTRPDRRKGINSSRLKVRRLAR